MRFRDSARRLSGLAGALLGWPPDQFWRATPAELAAVLEALAPPAGEGMSSADVARLREMFPDD